MSQSAHSRQSVFTMALLIATLLLASACSIETREEAARLQQAKNTNNAVANNSSAYPADDPMLPIKTTQLTLAGKPSTTVLTDARGFVLYYYVPDMPTKPACTGGCLTAWPPLLTESNQVAFCQSKLPGKFTLQKIASGYQVAYNGHLLYTFINDRRPGQITGHGIYDWYAVTPELK